MEAIARRKWIQQKICFITLPEFISNGRAESMRAFSERDSSSPMKGKK
jgi:hypothetical protein